MNTNELMIALYEEAVASDETGEDMIAPAELDELSPDEVFALVARAEREARRWRKVKATVDYRMALTLEGRQVRYGDTLYRSKRKTTRTIPEDRRRQFAEWVAEGGAPRVTQLFNPNAVRFGQLRELDYIDVVTGEILDAFAAFVEEIAGEDAPWALEAIPVSRLKYAQAMPEGEVQ